jgi:hypothetical protein
MKTKSFFALLAAICLTSTISFAQDGGNSNPYAIFGGNPHIAGERSDAERVKVLVIENIAEGSRVARLEHDTQTGVVTFFDSDGIVLGQKQLAPGERAWPTMDPKAEKYYGISPYAFTLNNPVRYIDPNGMDVWEFDDMGNVLSHTKTKEHDAFYIMQNVDGDWQRSGQELVFEYGTVTGYRTPSINVRGADGSVSDTQLTIFEMKCDNNAAQLFEFMANPGVTTNVEWTHAKIGTESSGLNIVGTNHSPNSTGIGGYLLKNEWTLREVNHNHPNGVPIPSGADMQNVQNYTGKFPNVGLNIYVPSSGYSPYNSSGTMDPRVIYHPDGTITLPDGRKGRIR